MRTEKNTRHPVRFLIRRNLFLAAAVFVAVFAVMPLMFITVGRTLSTSFTNMLAQMPANLIESEGKRLAGIYLGELFFSRRMAELVAFFFAGIGALSALVLQMHRFDRRSAIMQASLPVKRGSDFLHRLLAFAALVLVPAALCLGISEGILRSFSFGAYVDQGLLAGRFAALLLIIVYGYAAGSLASVITGRIWAAVLGVGVIAFTPELLCICFGSLAPKFLETLTYMKESSMIRWSPCFSLYKWMYAPGSFSPLNGILAIVIFLLAAWYLSRIRPTEAAGHTLAFRLADPILTLWLSALGGTIVGMAYEGMVGTEAALLGGMAAGALLTGIACHLLFTLRIRGLLRKLWMPAVSFALLLTVVLCLRQDAFGYDRYMPRREDVQAVTIQATVGDALGQSSYTLSDAESIDAVCAYVATLRDSSVAQPRGYRDRPIPYPVTVTWKTAGGEVARIYRHLDSDASRAAVGAVVESPGFRDAMANGRAVQMLRKAADDSAGNIYVHFGARFYLRTSEERNLAEFSPDALKLNFPVNADPTTYRALADAISADFGKRTLRDLRSVMIATLSFSGALDGTGTWEYYDVPLYACDTQVLSVLYGERAEEAIAYLCGGFMNEPNTVAIRVRYTSDDPKWWQLNGRLMEPASALAPLGGTAEERASFARNFSYTGLAQTWLGFVPEQREYVLIATAENLENCLRDMGFSLPDPLPRSEAEWVEWLDAMGLITEIKHYGAFFALPAAS